MKIWKNLLRNKTNSIINILGLATALACVLVVALYVHRELSFDSFHSKAHRIFRVTMNTNTGLSSMNAARIRGGWASDIAKEYSSVEKMVRLMPYRKSVVQIENNSFYSEMAFSTDSTFFDVFDFKLLSGTKTGSFSEPGQAFITKSLALKYFGSTDVLGKEINILGQNEGKPYLCNVKGVLEDFPYNSHFHVDILTSLSDFTNMDRWAYTYFLLKNPNDAKTIVAEVQKKWDKEAQNSTSSIIELQNIKDIHLKSHKTRELEANKDIRSIYLLLSGAFIILLIAFVNYINLKRVEFLKSLPVFKVKMINGASKYTLVKEQLLNTIPIVFLVLFSALFEFYQISDYWNLDFTWNEYKWIYVIVILLFMFLLMIVSIIPTLTTRIEKRIGEKVKIGRISTFPLAVQFTLAIVAIISTIVLSKQLTFMQNLHPEAKNSNTIVMPYNTSEIHQNYELLKSELQKNPNIEAIAAAMEEPGGDINDGFPFSIEGIDAENLPKSINIFTTDDNFFSLLDVKPLAGTTEFGNTPSIDWEMNALNLTFYEQNFPEHKSEIEKLKQAVSGYKEKYILNMSALKLLGIDNPQEVIGKKFRINYEFAPTLFPDGEVIGVVPDFHYTNLHRIERPLVIVSKTIFSSNYLIRFNKNNQKKALADIHKVWTRLNPDYPMHYQFISDTYKKVYSEEYAQSQIIGLFSIVSILLSVLGVLALSSFNVERRTKEIGIRKVNGAAISEILKMLNKDFIKWILISFVIATPIAYYAMNRWLQSFAYKTALSWWIFALAGIIALAIALLTVSWQSWRAASRNPVEALRYE